MQLPTIAIAIVATYYSTFHSHCTMIATVSDFSFTVGLLVHPIHLHKCDNLEYRMTQNFDGEKFDESGHGKILTSKKLVNTNVLTLWSS